MKTLKQLEAENAELREANEILLQTVIDANAETYRLRLQVAELMSASEAMACEIKDLNRRLRGYGEGLSFASRELIARIPERSATAAIVNKHEFEETVI